VGFWSNFRRSSPNWREAEHPGYRNRADQARGGTRREVTQARVTARVNRAITRREPDMPAIRRAAAAIREEQEVNAKVAKLEREIEKARKQRREVGTRTLRQLRQAQAQAVRARKAARKAAGKGRRR
jgi:hypothetical protein